MLTVIEDHNRIFQALKAEAIGYLLKKTAPAKLLEAIQELQDGGARMSGPMARQVVAVFQAPPTIPFLNNLLTQRQDQIPRLLAQGFLYNQTADRLGIS